MADIIISGVSLLLCPEITLPAAWASSPELTNHRSGAKDRQQIHRIIVPHPRAQQAAAGYQHVGRSGAPKKCLVVRVGARGLWHPATSFLPSLYSENGIRTRQQRS